MQAPASRAHVGGLDGLRALAVLAVVLYHCDVGWIPGGFLGVDVFFVISGYLITSQLWSRSFLDGRVDLARFWSARIRRLLPALACLLVVSTLAAALLDRSQLGSYLGDLLAAATYTSNWWYVLHQRSYFDSMGRPPVLQHLWSLAVEEQFYLLWPLVVAVVLASTGWVGKRQRRLLLVCLGLGLASAAWMGIGTALAHAPLEGDPSRYYFGTDSHASGLLLGAALAVLRAGRGFTREMPDLRPAPALGQAWGFAALLAVCWSFVEVTAWTSWLYRVGFLFLALVMCVLVAVATRPGPLERLLDLPPLAAIGRRSYGIYLWHWPVVVFTRPGLDLPLGQDSALVLRLLLTALLSEACYRWVEQPVRRLGLRGAWRALGGRAVGRWPARRVLAGTMAGLAVLTGASAATAPASSPAAEQDVTSQPAAVASPSAGATAASSASASSASASRGPSAAASAKAVASAGASASARSTSRSLVVYGDSVVLDAVPELKQYFSSITTHAVVGEQSWTLLDQLSANASSITADVLLVHTGDNGIIDEQKMLDTLAKVPTHTKIVLVLPRVPRPWQDQDLKVLRDVAQKMPRVSLADWYDTSAGQSSWFVDGVHMNETGVAHYVPVITAAAG